MTGGVTNMNKIDARSKSIRELLDGVKYSIDGQQRLTSLPLLLIYLYNLQRGRTENERVDVDKLIYSEKYGTKSFNLDIEERIRCIDTLYNNQPFDAADCEQPESVRSVAARYNDIVENFPETLKNGTLPYFMDWLIDNVDLVEITAYSDDEAYTIFEGLT